MGKEDEIEKDRKKWESDEGWELRKAFMLAHYDDFPKIQLQCLSQLFVNVTLLGCEYNESLMKKINELGRGIHVSTEKIKSGNFVKASVAKKRQAVKLEDLDGAEIEKKKKIEVEKVEEKFEEKLVALKSSLALTPHHLSSEQMLKTATSKCCLRWFVKKNGTNVDIYIDRFLVLKHKFSQFCVDAQEAAINAVVESFLTCEPKIKGMEICFNDHQADKCYSNSVERSLRKVRTNIMTQPNFKGLSKCLEAVNMSVIQNTKKLEGWSQQLDLVASDVLLASRILSSKECTRPAMATIADQMALTICKQIWNNTKIILAENSHSSLAFSE